MRHCARVVCWVLVTGSVTAAAQQRLALPAPASVEAAQASLLDEVACLLVRGAAPGENVDRLLARASAEDLTPALRCALAEQAARCARAARDVAMGLRVADWLADTFAVERDTTRADAIAAFENARAAAAQVLADAWLAEAERLLEGDVRAFATCVDAALRTVVAHQPVGLAALVQRRVEDLRAVRAAFERCRAAPDDDALRGRYRALYRGDFAAALPDLRRGTDQVGRAAASKRDARRDPVDALALAAVAQRWLSVAGSEPEPVVRANLRRRALEIMGEVCLATTPMMLGNQQEISEPEHTRVQRLFDRVGELMAEGGDAFVQRFADAKERDAMVITAGEWRVEGGALIGRSTGEATRATLPWAWKRIASVTIRGEIRSAGNLNFRVAVGPCNAILNWELDDVNPIWFGEIEQRVGPRALVAGRENAIHVRQLGELIGVFVDGRLLTLGPGQLAGTVSVYPALGSEIAVRQIEVVGDLDLGQIVRGPLGTAR